MIPFALGERSGRECLICPAAAYATGDEIIRCAHFDNGGWRLHKAIVGGQVVGYLLCGIAPDGLCSSRSPDWFPDLPEALQAFFEAEQQLLAAGAR